MSIKFTNNYCLIGIKVNTISLGHFEKEGAEFIHN